MLRFVLRKLLHKKWMVASLIIGNVLLIAVACSNPMYGEASLQRMLTDDLGKYLNEKNIYPGRMLFSSVLRSGSGSAARQNFKAVEKKAETASDYMGVAELMRVSHYYLDKQKSVSTLEKEENRELTNLKIGFLSDLEEHVKLVSGRMYSGEPAEDGTVEAIVSERAMVEMNFLVDEVIECPKITDDAGNPLRIRITGVFKNKEKNDLYWVYTPSAYYNECFIGEGIFRERFMGDNLGIRDICADWFTLLDHTDMKSGAVRSYLEKSEQYAEEFQTVISTSYRESFSGVLTSYLAKERKVRVTLLVLQIPVLMLLCSFIFMISGQMLEIEQNEIAMLKSRGSGKGQILLIYLVQSAVIAGFGLAAGLPLGSLLCRVLGSSDAFLEFIRRRSLAVTVDGTVLLYGLAAALVSGAAMVLPVFQYAKVTIVDSKRKKSRKTSRAVWQRMYLDVILLGISLYGFYSFREQQDITLKKVLSGESIDPLLFISSSLFIVGAALVALRILPLLTRLVYQLFKRVWGPASYASFLQILRTGGKQRFIMVFLMLTIALGIFNAATARTILSNAEKNLRYDIGADVVFQEKWNSNEAGLAGDPDAEVIYEEPDFGKYEELSGVRSVTRVLRQDNLSMQVNGEKLTTITLMGIRTKEFGETAEFDVSLYPIHPYEYLNAMSVNANAVLVSSNFKKLGYGLGDVIYYTGRSKQSEMGIIYGFVDYWPSWKSTVKALAQDGTLRETTNYLIVAHLAQLTEDWGVEPYEVWMKTKGSSSFLYDFVEENDVELRKFEDTAAELVELKNDTVFQGTSGILTISFIVVLILCGAGFLIYWILSIRSRELQFGIFRAMGMSMGEVLHMLVNEQIFISGLSVGMGAAIGMLASRLYIPLIQLAYSASDQSIPLTILIQREDMLRLFVIVGGVLLVCMGILGVLIRKINISQAIKLGED